MEAVKQDIWALQHASEGLRGDRAVVMEAVKRLLMNNSSSSNNNSKQKHNTIIRKDNNTQ